MTSIVKSSAEPELSVQPQNGPAYYQPNGPAVEYIGDIDDEVHVRQIGSGTRLAERTEELTQRIGERIDRASEAVQRVAQKTADRAQRGAKTTAQAAREHPVMAAAIVGGIATAALAGVSIYRASRRAEPNLADDETAPTRKSLASKTSVKRKTRH